MDRRRRGRLRPLRRRGPTTWDTALAALKAHRSQLSEEIADKHFPQGREETAKKAGLNFAEAFKTIKLW